MSDQNKRNKEELYIELVFKLLYLILGLLIFIGALVYINIAGVPDVFKQTEKIATTDSSVVVEVKLPISDLWKAPDTSTIINEKNAELISYGKNLNAQYSC